MKLIKGKNMEMSDGEKLITLMLTELYEKLEINGEIDPDFIRSAIFTDNLWAIPWRFTGIPFQDQSHPEIVNKTLKILQMWGIIESSYGRLNDDDKLKLEELSPVAGKYPKFLGFSVSKECDYLNIAHFLVNDLNRFVEFKGRELNSHHESLDIYNRMLPTFDKEWRESMYSLLSAEKLAMVLNEMVHPENRNKE